MVRSVVLFACFCAGVRANGDLQAVLQQVVTQMHTKYNMSIAAAVQTINTSFSAAAGYTDSGLGLGTPSRKALPDDLYVWGSTTKMFTAPAVLQLVEQGVVSLTDPISQHIDPILTQLNGSRLADHFGSAIETVQIQHLLHMTSGINDYDGDAFAQAQFANRSKAFGPVEIIGKYVDPKLRFVPGARQSYCSTNYILLGFVLATHYHKEGTSWSWQAFDQMEVIPAALRKAFGHSKFVNAGGCNKFTPVHGFLESYVGSSIPTQDVWDVSCAGGWTAGNYIGSVADVASFTYDLYNTRDPRIVSAASQAHMINFTTSDPLNFGRKFYGMGTFSLDWSIGDGEAYGHVGDTYGYQSQTTYFPGMDFVISVATNVETSSQAQPADTTCLAYHALMAAMQGASAPTCTFTVPHRFIGTCTCTSEIVV